MTSNTRLMLEALKHSSNESTQRSAKALLGEGILDWAPPLADYEKLATTGRLGGLIVAVMTGDFLAAYGAADIHNQRALRSVLGPDNDRW
jgi:hypothetical protein